MLNTNEYIMFEQLRMQRIMHITKELAEQMSLVSKLEENINNEMLYKWVADPFEFSQQEIKNIISTAKSISNNGWY